MNIIKSTNGKKTYSISAITAIFQLFVLMFPEVISPENENTIELILGSGIISTLTHKIIRNWSKIRLYILKLIKKE